MYIVDLMMTVPLAKVDEVIGIYQSRSWMVDAWPGFVSFQLLQNEHHPEELKVHMEWASKDDYLAWVTSGDYKHVHSNGKAIPRSGTSRNCTEREKYRVVARLDTENKVVY